MSRANYSQYLLEEQIKKKLEEERKRLLEEERRRQEEARRKEMELRRLREIEAGKERLKLMREFRDKASSVSKKSAKVQKRPVSPVSKTPVDNYVQDPVREINELTQKMKRDLENIPPEWEGLLSSEISKIKQLVRTVEDQGHDPVYYQQVKWANRDLEQLKTEAPQKIEDFSNKAAKAREDIDELAVQLQVVQAKGVLADHREKAARMIRTLDELSQENHPDKLVSHLSHFDQEVNELYQEFEMAQEKDQERRHVLQNAQEVLESLGYQVMDLESTSNADKRLDGTQPLSLQFLSPEKALIRIDVGLDNAIYSEYLHLKKKGESGYADRSNTFAMEHRCQQWCKDYDYLLHQLSLKNIKMDEKWRESSAPENHQVIEVSEDFLRQFEIVSPSTVLKIKESK